MKYHKRVSRRTVFVPYTPKTILNKGRRADHWFWTRYSAYPYLGCQHGCHFCYCRERKFSPYADPADFAHVIKVKANAPELLRRALQRVPVDAVFTGDYQPAERKFEISRRMLEVCLDLGFPVFILERSPLVLRDLDLITALHARARATVAFSLITAPGSPHFATLRVMENLAPAPEKRLAAMARLAAAGIPTGACLMPLLPGLADTDANLAATIRAVAEHGGTFVLAGGLTLADQQRAYFFDVLRARFPDLLPGYEALYPAGSYGAVGSQAGLHRRVRALCEQYGLRDRAPRMIIPGEKRALNKRLAERLANQVWELELAGAPAARQWAGRKAAWAVDDLEQDIGLVYRSLGRTGLEHLPGLTPALARWVERQIEEEGVSG